MGVRLIRQNSNTPNVTNIDDARMVRYAYGGYDGYVKNRGTECGYSVNGVNFRITSGVLSLQGWESEVDSNGWNMVVDNIAQKRYFSVYYEVNGAAGTAEIKSIYDTAGYPTIDPGDDLTRTTNGTARLLLYTFTSTNGIIADVAKKVKRIEYTMSKLIFSDSNGVNIGSKEDMPITIFAHAESLIGVRLKIEIGNIGVSSGGRTSQYFEVKFSSTRELVSIYYVSDYSNGKIVTGIIKLGLDNERVLAGYSQLIRVGISGGGDYAPYFTSSKEALNKYVFNVWILPEI